MAIKIVTLYANDDNGIYGDIFNTPEEVEEAHPGETILTGYGILDTDTGYLVDESKDFYSTVTEAFADVVDMGL